MARKLTDWLKAEGFGIYISAFAEHDIDFDILAELTELDLAELGLSIGARKRMMMSIAAYTGATSSAPELEVPLPAPVSELRPSSPKIRKLRAPVLRRDRCGRLRARFGDHRAGVEL